MNNILETHLELTHPPASILEFNRIKKATIFDKELWEEKTYLDIQIFFHRLKTRLKGMPSNDILSLKIKW